MIAPAELASNVIAMEKKRLAASSSRTQTELTRQVFHLHRPETLLHTMRCIAQYEDVLCEVSHEIRTAGRVSNQASAELRSIVSNLPSEDYMHDLNSVRATFVEVKPSKPSSLKRKKKPGNFANAMRSDQMTIRGEFTWMVDLFQLGDRTVNLRDWRGLA